MRRTSKSEQHQSKSLYNTEVELNVAGNKLEIKQRDIRYICYIVGCPSMAVANRRQRMWGFVKFDHI